MAVRRLSVIIVFLVAIMAIAALQFSLRLQSEQRISDDRKFAKIFVELSVAGEMYGSYPDSLKTTFDRIFQANKCDSTWMYDHQKGIARDSDRYERIWDQIVDTLDSLKNAPIDPANPY